MSVCLEELIPDLLKCNGSYKCVTQEVKQQQRACHERKRKFRHSCNSENVFFHEVLLFSELD